LEISAAPVSCAFKFQRPCSKPNERMMVSQGQVAHGQLTGSHSVGPRQGHEACSEFRIALANVYCGQQAPSEVPTRTYTPVLFQITFLVPKPPFHGSRKSIYGPE